MPSDRHFVGRRSELDKFRRLLLDPAGKAIVITGGQGMGKSFLARRMVEVAETDPVLRCAAVRYEVAATDPVEEVMSSMLDHAWAALGPDVESSAAPSPHRRKQWRALVDILPRGSELADLIAASRPNARKSPRDQLVEGLAKISARLPDEARLLVLIDAEKEMPEKSDQAWRLVVRNLPERIVFLFPQRPSDALASSDEFRRLDQVVFLPEEALGPLASSEVEELLHLVGEQSLEAPADAVREHLARLDGHPYAVAATLDLLEQGVPLADLPSDPDGIAAEQWKRVKQAGVDAQRLFAAHAVLEVPVPDDVVREVAGIEAASHRTLLADSYLAGLLLDAPAEGDAPARRIYHSLLSNRVLEALSGDEARALHAKAARAHERRLWVDQRPSSLAATRLPEHARAGEGEEAFVEAGIRCLWALWHLGLLDEAVELGSRLAEVVVEGSEQESRLANRLSGIYLTLGDLDQAEALLRKSFGIAERIGWQEGMARASMNLGLIYRDRGELGQAEEIVRESLAISESLDWQEGRAKACGILGLILRKRGALDEAEAMHEKSLEINERLKRQEGIAKEFGNLGLIWRDRGDLEQAEMHHRRSLEIEERLARLQGMASECVSLSHIYRRRGDPTGAEGMLRKALDLFRKVGARPRADKAERLLATLYPPPSPSGPHPTPSHPVWRVTLGEVEVRFTGRGPEGHAREVLERVEGRRLPLAYPRQVHSATVLRAAEDGRVGDGDAVWTDRAGLALAVVTADCVPVVLAGGRCVAAVHAGWRGIVGGVVPTTVAALGEQGVEPEELVAWVGPAIGVCCYEVSDEVAEQVAAASSPEVVGGGPSGKPFLDLPGAVRRQLEAAGVSAVRVLVRCTRCDEENLWSYRREGKKAGRNVAFVWRREEEAEAAG